MGRYLDALKNKKICGGDEPNKPKKPEKGGLLGFLGTPPPTFENNQAANDDANQPDTAVSFVWLIHYSERDPLPVSFAEAMTHAEALAGYPDAVAAEPIAPPPPIETSCRDCRHFARPGHSSGYCAGRDDLPLAYGANHPLRKLPDDGGASCLTWQATNYEKEI